MSLQIFSPKLSWLGRNYIYYDTLPSTNDLAKKELELLPHGTVIRAGYQTAGRGQYGRSWISPAGDNIFVSVVLKPGIKFNSPGQDIGPLRQIAARAVICTVKDLFGLEAEIKAPNDVYLNLKKLAGILIETVTRGDTVRGIVIGIGLNCNTHAFVPELQELATSIEIEYGKKIDVDVCFTVLLEFCELFFSEWLQNYE